MQGTNASCDSQPLQSNCSAVFESNYTIFYLFHGLAIGQIIISITASLIVLATIGRHLKGSTIAHGRFSDRFPLYIAVCDLMWGVAHLIDHLILFTTEKYPGWWVVFIISRVNSFLMGYQQLLYASVAVYTYLKIVREMQFQLGRWEWKLHGLCVLVVGSVTLAYSLTGMLGISRYWLIQNDSHPQWMYAHYFTCVVTSIQAISTIFTYYSIKRMVLSSQSNLSNVKANMSTGNSSGQSYHTTAAKCLTTFVVLGIVLYLPLAMFTCVLVIQHLFNFNFIDTSSLNSYSITGGVFVIIFINCGGFANSVAYFYNEHLKRERQQVIK